MLRSLCVCGTGDSHTKDLTPTISERTSHRQYGVCRPGAGLLDNGDPPNIARPTGLHGAACRDK